MAGEIALADLRSAQFTAFLTKLRGSSAWASISGSQARRVASGSVLPMDGGTGNHGEGGAPDEFTLVGGEV